MKILRAIGAIGVLAIFAAVTPRCWAGADAGPDGDVVQGFLEKHCLECHEAVSKKGGLDLTELASDLSSPRTFASWVGVHDRVSRGEMPPKNEKKPRPEAAEVEAFTKALSGALVAAEQAQMARDGRATQRRLNRYEYENVVRDLLHAPWLQLKDALPEDGESHRFNKIGDALDVSHVQVARYLGVADAALRQVMATQVGRPEPRQVRYPAREQRSFTGKMKFSVFNTRPERATFPLLGTQGQPDVRSGKAPMTAGDADPDRRELEAVGVVASSYEPLEVKFNAFVAPVSGHYRLRINAYSVWVGPGKDPKKWYIPDLDDISAGRRPEPVTIYGETPPRLLRRLGGFDVTPEPSVHELDVWLLAGETLRPDAARLFRSRPPNWQNPLAEKDGCPGVAYRWLEVEGPLYDEWPTAGHRLLFGDLPLRQSGGASAAVEVVSDDPEGDAGRLLRDFVRRAYRRPVAEGEEVRFLPVIEGALKSGSTFADAMIAGYTAVLCSPEFVCLEEPPGRLDDHALATRLAFFLWNSAPDDGLRALATRGELHRPEVLRAQADRLLDDPRARRFVDAFLDYWLDLRKIVATAPDAALYPDYYLDDLLSESALEETQLFFAELLRGDLPARNVVASDFAMLNERLAAHYGLPPVEGVAVRKVPLPADSPRGGLMTQASVLKVTANGTTTSPVVRGAWIMERILGMPPPPPPPSVPAVEPDTRGATTIRAQLDKHRTQQSCAACHAKIDPAGFALENFDVMGGWRDRYRAISEGPPEPGIGHNGQKFAFHPGAPVDAGATLPDGRTFGDIRELKRLLADDEEQVARNLTRQLVVYATGAPVRFGDRPHIERILDRARPGHFGVRTLIHEIVQSDLFLNK
jgi:mono/diheme cytochrome c family protein